VPEAREEAWSWQTKSGGGSIAILKFEKKKIFLRGEERLQGNDRQTTNGVDKPILSKANTREELILKLNRGRKGEWEVLF